MTTAPGWLPSVRRPSISYPPEMNTVDVSILIAIIKIRFYKPIMVLAAPQGFQYFFAKLSYLPFFDLFNSGQIRQL